MEPEEFWEKCIVGGTTPQYDTYTVIADGCEQYGKLHILSRGNRNQTYNIKKKTALRYFDELQHGTEEVQSYRRNGNAYFSNVYDDIVG